MSSGPARPWSLRLRLALVFLAGSLAMLVVVLGFLDTGFSREIGNRNRRLLVDRVQDVVTVLTNHPDDLGALREDLQEDASLAETRSLTRILRDGRQLLASPGMEVLLPEGVFPGRAAFEASRRHFLLLERTVGPFRVQAGLDVTEDLRMLQAFRRRLLATLLLLTAGSCLVGFWAAHQGLKPLRALAETTRGITARNLGQRLEPEKVPPELASLVHALNAMLDRLDHAFERLSRFSGDLAHELRTPLTNLISETELLLAGEPSAGDCRRVLESSIEEFRNMSGLISRMLFLARVEDPGNAVRPRPVEAGTLVEEVLGFFEAMAEDREVRLVGRGDGTFQGDRDLLRQALVNLVGNALEATAPGGTVAVAVGPAPGGVAIEVEDDGRGIPAEALAHVFDRFYRTPEALDRKLPGTGLGLAIVKSIAQLHGGGVQIRSEPGAGTTVRMLLPQATGPGPSPAGPVGDRTPMGKQAEHQG